MGGSAGKTLCAYCGKTIPPGQARAVNGRGGIPYQTKHVCADPCKRQWQAERIAEAKAKGTR